MPEKRRALILFATMTKNTEKVADWFRQTFDSYDWEVQMVRLTNHMDLDALQPNVYFDDYDVVCLGSPIVAGYPLKIVSQLFSLGAHTGLEEQTAKLVSQGSERFSAPPTEGGMPAGPKELSWRHSKRGPYPGVIYQHQYHPLGVVFTTYGGGFYGSDECTATLEILKLFLQLNNVSVVGRFACCGKEYGPAGLLAGEKPQSYVSEDGITDEVPDPIYYTKKDGTSMQGSYFFHYNNWLHPGPRDEAKAKALIGDLVEDYFMTYNGERNMVGSQYISIS